MIRLRDVHKTYVTKKGLRVKALDGVSIIFPEKGMVFILGKSGSGKSTLLNLIGGLDKFDSGEMIVNNKSTSTFSQGNLDSYRNTSVGFVFQDYNLLEEFTVEKNIALAIELQGMKPTSDKINSILKEVDLDGYAQRKPNELSGGQLQRVAIARALIKNPQIILADEPTGALDSNTGFQIFDTLKKLSNDKLVLIISHDREYAEVYGDRIIELSDGRVISDSEKHLVEANLLTENIEILGESLIRIKKGTTITDTDVSAVASYISAANSDAYLFSSDDLNAKLERVANLSESGARDAFKQTELDDVLLADDGKTLQLVKSRLPLKSAMRIGAGALKYRKIRLAIAIIMSLIALCMFGITDSMSTFDALTSTCNTILKSDTEYIRISQLIMVGGDGSKWYKPKYSSVEDIKNLTQTTQTTVIPYYQSRLRNINYNFKEDRNKLFLNSNDFYVLLADQPSSDLVNFVTVTDELLVKLDYSYVGKLPVAKNEVAISKYFFDHYKVAGYKTMTIGDMTPEAFLALKPEFYIGSNEKTPSVITAIIDTKIDYSALVGLPRLNYFTSVSRYEPLHTGFHLSVFMSSDALDELIYTETAGELDLNVTCADGSILEDWDLTYREIEFLESPNYFAFNGVDNSPLGTDAVVITFGLAKKILNLDSLNHTAIIAEGGEALRACLAELDDKLKEVTFAIGYDPYPDGSSYRAVKIAGIIKPQFGQTDYLGVYISGSVIDFVKDGGKYTGVTLKITEDSIENIINMFNAAPDSYSVTNNQVSNIMQSANFLEEGSKIFVYITIPLVALAVFLCMNYIANSISHKRKEIGILRAIGARGKDVLAIFLTESLIMAFITFVLSTILTFVLGNVLNTAIPVALMFTLEKLLYIGIRQVLLIFAVSMGSGVVACGIPIFIEARKKPVDIIRQI
ncbi:MAG: ABC transporter ATP-binding protein/permease [Christensenellaceae bacterium]|jgi:ABC-type lipoprotein export system ATPase subunit/ABC-type antimicrobial peptide transport system permease subunit|nr:ABC transporter ATP-binding protein/permease [Christensenellaceae bacterium]